MSEPSKRPFIAAVLSAILPGVGQIYNGDRLQGGLVLALVLGALGYVLFNNGKLMEVVVTAATNPEQIPMGFVLSMFTASMVALLATLYSVFASYKGGKKGR